MLESATEKLVCWYWSLAALEYQIGNKEGNRFKTADGLLMLETTNVDENLDGNVPVISIGVFDTINAQKVEVGEKTTMKTLNDKGIIVDNTSNYWIFESYNINHLFVHRALPKERQCWMGIKRHTEGRIANSIPFN